MLNTRLYTKTQNTRAAKPRAAILLEFVLTLPFTLIFLMFVVDMGRMYLAAGAVHDAAWRAARAAAVAGGASINATGVTPVNGITPTVIEDSFYRSLRENQSGATISLSTITSSQPLCTTTSDIIHVTAKARIPTLTPGLNVLLGAGTAQNWNVSVAAVARCQVAK